MTTDQIGLTCIMRCVTHVHLGPRDAKKQNGRSTVLLVDQRAPHHPVNIREQAEGKK